jgi:hypothetical protein
MHILFQIQINGHVLLFNFCLLFIVYCLLFIVYCLLFIVYLSHKIIIYGSPTSFPTTYNTLVFCIDFVFNT